MMVRENKDVAKNISLLSKVKTVLCSVSSEYGIQHMGLTSVEVKGHRNCG